LYPNIDVEYVFHEKGGIKYSLILHPGADPSKIQMKYSGADKVYKDPEGQVHLVTPLGDIIDHAPFTFYESDKSEIHSSFLVGKNIVSFKLDGYNASRTVVIDPWTIGVALPASNKALEMERDAAGNVYVLGGTNGTNTNIPMILQKYSAAGVFQWQFSPVLPLSGGGRFTGEYGNDLKVDKVNNIYIVAGGGLGHIFKLNPLGTVLWTIGTNTVEPYRLGMDCASTSLYVISGMAGSSSLYNTNTGALISNLPQMFVPNLEDLRDFVRAPNGNYYGLSATQATGAIGRLLAFSPSFTNLWGINHNYPFSYWSHAYTGHYPNQPASIHVIAVSKNFIYTTSGSVLEKRNLTTGAVIGGVGIPGGILATNGNGNSGIILDTCENVYVSSQGGVYKYDSNLNLIASAATPAAVYDICLGINNEILACGNGFLASLSLSACIPYALTVTASATPTGNCSNGNIGTATATITGGEPSYSYYWIPGGQTSQSISGLAAGTYSVIVGDRDCNADTAVVTVTGSGALVVAVTKTDLQCNGGSNGSVSLSVSGGTAAYTYSWSTGSNAAAITGLGAGTYSATVRDANGCTSVISASITQPVPIPITLSVTSTTCNNPNGSAIATVSGPTGPFSYFWSNGTTGATINGLAPGTYTVTVTDANGCTNAATATIASSTSPASATFTQSPSGTVCVGTTVTFTNTGTTGYSYWYITPTYIYAPGVTDFSYAFVTPGTYTITHSVYTGGCQALATGIVQVVPCSSTPSVTAQGGSVCLGECATVTSSPFGGTAPYVYLWNTGATTQNITACPTSTTVYSVTITDAASATASTTATVTVNPSVTVTITAGSINCFGGTTTATAAATGGSPGFTYSWSNGEINASASNLSSGNYSVTVTDSQGCTSTASISITEPPALTASVAVNNSSCSGANGSATVSVSGGTPGYTYNWSNSQTTSMITALAAGSYSVTITDANGCTQTDVATISTLSGPTVTVTSTNVNCNGQNTGTATAVSSGGTSPYTYLWSNAQANATATNLWAGTYTVTVSDANNCSSVQTVTITEPSAMGLVVTANNAACQTSTGDATVTATGGTGAYTYSWSNSQVGQTATGLSAGVYTVTVTDNSGCSKSALANVSNTGSPWGSISSVNNVLCNGANNGSATVNVTVGSPQYTYLWNNGQTTATASGLAAGNHQVTVTDALGCIVIIDTVISEPAALTSSVTVNPTSCVGSTGSATVSASGGTPGYTYTWSNSQTTATITGLSVGNYSVTITDANGCVQTDAANVSTSSGPSITITSSSNVSCNGSNDGAAVASASGGTSPLTYLWNNSQTTATATNLAPGNYSVTVSDANNCTALQAVAITEPTAITLSVTTNNAACLTSTGNAVVTATGGSGAYTYVWSNTQTLQTATGLAAGVYTITVTDNSGCSQTALANVSNTGSPWGYVSSVTNVACNGASTGSATVNVTVGSPQYTYLWNNGQTTATASGLAAGNHQVIVTDALGCIVIIDTVITEPAAIATLFTSTQATCGNTNGTATAASTGGSPAYTYQWSNGQTNPTASNLAAGNYSVSITDSKGCVTMQTVSVPGIGGPVAAVNPNVTIIVGNSAPLTATGGGTYVWSHGAGTSAILVAPSITTEYCVTVTDINNCSDTACVTVFVKEPLTDCSTESPAESFYLPNAFSPDGNGENDLFMIQHGKYYEDCIREVYIAIYSRWGEKVFESDDLHFTWDGTFKNNLQNTAVYVYYLKASMKDGGEVIKKGNITLLR